MMDTRFAIGRWRTFIKSEGKSVFSRLQTFLEDPVLLPLVQDFNFSLGIE